MSIRFENEVKTVEEKEGKKEIRREVGYPREKNSKEAMFMTYHVECMFTKFVWHLFGLV